MVGLPITCDRCGKRRMHYGRCECAPGILTVYYGDERVIVDSLDPPEKFKAAQKRANELIALIGKVDCEVTIK